MLSIRFGRKSSMLLEVFTESKLFREIQLFCYLFNTHCAIFEHKFGIGSRDSCNPH